MNKAIIFDRDGVLNYTVQRENEVTAPWTLKEFKMIPGSIEAVEMAKELGYLALVATNQPDVRDKKMKEEEKGRRKRKRLRDYHIYHSSPPPSASSYNK